MKSASSEARKAINDATSSAVPVRPIRVGKLAGPSRVAIAHGEMQFTVTPNSAISNARLFVNAMMAPFEVAYIAGVPPCIPATEDRLMILPERCAFMARAAARVAQ